MLSRSRLFRGYEKWPWPVELPLKKQWYTALKGNVSVSQDVRGVQQAGDVVVCLALGFLAFRAYSLATSGAYQSRLKHLTGAPPAIIAQDFDFAEGAANRQLSRARVDEYRAEFAAAKKSGTGVEEIIFKF
jgi:hypothetical protein